LAAIKQVINYNFHIIKTKQKHKHDVYKGQTKKVTLAKNFLQSNPCNTQIHNALSTTQTILVDEMQQDLDEQAHKARAKWAHFNNTYSRTFSNSTKQGLKKLQCKAS
jgi:hypothetical protein